MTINEAPQVQDRRPEDAPDPILATVALWNKRIHGAKRHWEADYKRMESNMRFAMGYQWGDQRELDDDRYIANLTLRAVNQKVASLYAKNPKAVANPRKRMYYQVWDGKLETLGLAVERATMAPDVNSLAIIEDYWQGQQMKEMLDRVAKTLEIVYQYQIDRHEPEFKKQMKRLVRRAVIAGVGYVRMRFEREYESSLMWNQDENTLTLARRMKELGERVLKGDIDSTAPEVEEMRVLATSLQAPPESRIKTERLLFDFPGSLSVIVDPQCTALQDFVGASWIAIEYVMPVREANAYFETNIEPGGSLVVRKSPDENDEEMVTIWEVFDKRTQSVFFLADGWSDYVSPPLPVEPRLHRFWPVFALTLNDVEFECEDHATIYPPSDVQLMKSAQKEWNRTRDELRRHRVANRPKYTAVSGTLTKKDLQSLEEVPSSGIIEMQSLMPGQKVGDLLQAIQHSPVDPTLYDVSVIKEDIMFTTGQQEANLGPAPSNVTATVGTIAEQSRLNVTSSNVDDLDGLLTDLARAGGETLLLNMSLQTVQNIAGPGAAWSEMNKELFANEVLLEIEAASSGRPNKAVEIANYERIAPLMLQAGANPQFLVREGIKRLDDRLDVEAAFPLAGAQLPVSPASPDQPLQQLPSEAPMPLVGHNQ